MAQREQTEARMRGRMARLGGALGGDRDGKRDGGEGPGRQTETRDRAAGGAARALLRTGGRLVLWAGVALVLARGIGDILAGEPVVEPRPGPRAVFPGAEAQAFAASFARAYLSWQPGAPEALRRRLAPYASRELVERLVPELPRWGRAQRVVETSVARSKPLGSGRGLVTVACGLVGRVDGVRYLAVSVARGPDGGLAVDAPPGLVAAPPLADVAPAEDVAVSGDEAGEITTLARAFLDAYLTGAKAGELGRLLAPGARVAPVRGAAAAVRVTDVIDVGASSARSRSVAVDARVQGEEGGATYPLRYRLELVRSDRWFVRSVAGDAT